ncbi:MAG: STAS-like domain-containing protein [Anaerorhabdus sp.]
MNTVLHYQLPTGFLASRNLAIPHRNHIEKAFYDSSIMKVEIDLANVESISESYADEIFGVLVHQYGFEEVLSKIQLTNANDFVMNNIAIVIDRRAHAVC